MNQDHFADLKRLVGRWRGTKKLWLDPIDPAAESATTAAITLEVRDHIVKLVYTWLRDGKRQEGQLLLGQGNRPADAQGMWADTWHLQEKIMVCQGQFGPQGEVTLQGSYPAAASPGWGWRIHMLPPENGLLRIAMDKITPAGQATRAVELHLQADNSPNQEEIDE